MCSKDHTQSEMSPEREEASLRCRISKVLKRTRVEAGLTQKALAEKVGIKSAYLSQIETGRRSPSFGLLTKLASALGTQASRIMLKAEFQKEDDEGQLILLLIKCLEQSPNIEKLLSSLRKLAVNNTGDCG